MRSIENLNKVQANLMARRKEILDRVQRENRGDLTAAETEKFLEIQRELTEVRDEFAEHKRAGRDNPRVAEVARATARAGDQQATWAARAAKALQNLGGESRAISSGSLDVPSLVEPNVVAKSRPARLIDLLVNRKSVDSNAFEYFRQTVRTNNAAPVADLGTKPTSTFTAEPVEDRCRVIAHLSQPVPIRLWQDSTEAIQWLDSEMRNGVLDTLEAQVLSGAGTGENLTGILTVSGTTAVAFATDIPTTMRKGVTALQNIGVNPNAWVVNPADAETLDLTKEGTGGIGFLLDGYQNGTDGSANVFGPTSIQRVVSPSVPSGTAILGDWSAIRLYVREDMRLDIDAGGTLFTQNAAIMRAEIRVGLGHLHPASFAICDLTA
jgi:HK97 family phage major capsid protein